MAGNHGRDVICLFRLTSSGAQNGDGGFFIKQVLMYLDKDSFLKIASSTPFVSIDLIIRNELGQILLGRRRNKPAQNYWFVPGGRIRKNERLQDALQRIARNELHISPESGKLLGIYDHFYDDNFYGKAGIGTHYVACGYEFLIEADVQFTADDQHAALKWWDLDALLASNEVHANVKLFFQDAPVNGLLCRHGSPGIA
nr:GDP-mannose mannosyl hydrolase [uncultured Noviherbaspirillum sp.]